jgi:hypothetical protein
VTLLHWLLETTGAYILTLFLTVLLLFFLPVFFASQTIPLLTQVVPTASKGEAAGTILFASTIGSFLGSVVTSIVLFQYIGVFKTGILVSVALLCVTALWRRKTHPRRVLVVCIASLLLLAW